MHKQEVPLPNIFQYSTVIWWKTVYMQHMSFKGHKRKITMSGCSELNMYVDEIPSELSSLEKLEQIRIAQRIVWEDCGHA